jgi:predicted 3-demethylubiquinone-9 3-methyltransferase (glyoxalase superfamily)
VQPVNRAFPHSPLRGALQFRLGGSKEGGGGARPDRFAARLQTRCRGMPRKFYRLSECPEPTRLMKDLQRKGANAVADVSTPRAMETVNSAGTIIHSVKGKRTQHVALDSSSSCTCWRSTSVIGVAGQARSPWPRSRAMPIKQRISSCLWFDGQAEEAANFYLSVFKNSRITAVSRYGEAGPGPKGSVMVVGLELDGQSFTAVNGGPMFKFTEAISMVVHCETQAEVDYCWEKLSAGGQEGRCAWLKDKFGVSWQIVPTALIELMQAKDARKSAGVMRAMLQMTKIDIAGLQRAYEGEAD